MLSGAFLWMSKSLVPSAIIGGYAETRFMLPYDITMPWWSRVTHICVSKLTIIVSDNGLLPRRREAIIWTNAGILLIWPLGTILLIEPLRNFNQYPCISLNKMHLKMSSAKSRPFFPGLYELTWVWKDILWCNSPHDIIIFHLMLQYMIAYPFRCWGRTILGDQGQYYRPLARYVKSRVAHAPGMLGTFSPHRELAIPTCITARAWRTCHDACQDR